MNPVVLNCAAITFIRDVACGVSACIGLKQGKSDIRCTTRKMLQPPVTAKGRLMIKGFTRRCRVCNCSSLSPGCPPHYPNGSLRPVVLYQQCSFDITPLQHSRSCSPFGSAQNQKASKVTRSPDCEGAVQWRLV